jgi:amino acid adenylation domain-containing protein
MTFVSLFEHQVARTPDAVAVEFHGASVTYAELNARANNLAHHLIDRGVRPGALVGLVLPRSADLVVAALAVMKSAAAYLPIDPAYPRDRVSFILRDARPAVVITTAETHSGFPGGFPGGNEIFLDQLEASIAAGPGNAPAVEAGEADAAYVIYTSGSTGNPKGVVVSHGALENFLLAMRTEFGPGPGAKLLAVTTIAFDIAGLELYLPLITGATVVLASGSDMHDPDTLVRMVRDSGVTMLQATPSLWQMLLDTGDSAAFRDVLMLVGGEALPPSLAVVMRQTSQRVANMYGPTETTIWSTREWVRDGTDVASIGHAIRNTRLYVLDDRLEPVPDRTEGELYIAGEGLARGYFNQPGLTAARFVANPFGPVGSRLYRTGDLVRRAAGGELIFLGRTDHQIKIRGFRVELGEIESVLADVPSIARVVVVARQVTESDKRLVAYMTAEPGSDLPTARQLTRFCRRRLPDYMVPSAFVAVERFPTTSNGKLDRGALPEPSWGTGTSGRAPRTALEEALCLLFAELLHVETVGIDDSFFDLGGHSVLGAQLVGRIRAEFGLKMSMTDLLADPTVAGVASQPATAGRSPVDPSRIEALLKEHELVADASVAVTDQVHAYVVPVENHADLLDGARQRLDEWQEIHEDHYANSAEVDLSEDFSIWKSSYDGKPIPTEEMREWRDVTVRRIRALRPRRILEIGVGNGLLLSELAGEAEAYWGTDFSAGVLRRVAAAVGQDPDLKDKVTLLHRDAANFTGIPAGHFDVIVLNSVVQYFPSAAYCLDVFGQAAGALAADGALFVGDVRNRRLLECFHGGVAAARSAAVHQSLARERELLIDPAFFAEYAQSGRGLRSAKIQLKRGYAQNELTRYRYDVVLSKTPNPADGTEVPEFRWGAAFSSTEDLARWTQNGAVRRFWAVEIPNARLALDLAAAAPGISPAAGLDPQDVVRAGEAAGYRVRVQWSQAAEDFDAYFEQGPLTETDDGPAAPRSAQHIKASLTEYFTNPVADARSGGLTDALRRHLTSVGSGLPHTLAIVDSIDGTRP